MDIKRFCILGAAALAFAISVAAATGAALAEPPEPVLRYFALVLPPGSTPADIPDFCPDLEDPASVLLVVHPSGYDDNPPAWQSTFDFMSSSARMSGEPAEPVEPCWDDGQVYPRGEVWVRSRDVTLATAGGSQTLTLFWKDELPPPGALAFTGPVLEGGQALFFDWFWVRPGEARDTPNTLCDPYTNHWFASKKQSPFFVWCIGVGLFSK